MKTDNIKIEPRWSKSKEDIWDEKFAGLDDSKPAVTVSLRKRNRIWMYVAAAAVAVIVMLPSVAFLYNKDIYVSRGEHFSVALPDGSSVQLNADSKLSYKPLWWRISRDVKLDGEAYFEVAKGSDFKVRSGDATVTVLGTSFNVFSRADRYNVTCLTGRVEVAKHEQSVILSPGMQALFENDRLFSESLHDASQVRSWTNNRFVFSGVPLQNVIEEIERQYDIEVFVNGIKPDYIYSGNFSRTEDPAEVLQIVVKPFGLQFIIR